MMDWREIDQWAEKEWPTVYKLLYPRVYEFGGEYHSPKMPAAFMVRALAQMLVDGVENSYTSYRLMLPGVAYLSQHMMPTFFIAPDMLKAIQLTDIHEDIDWVDLKLPFESAIFVLPKGGFTHVTDGECAFIMYVRHEPGYFNFPGPSGKETATYYSDHVFSILGFTPEKQVWYHANLNAEASHTTRLRNIFKTDDGKLSPSCITNEHDRPLESQDDPFVESMGVITFGTLLAMTARPDLLEKSTLIRKVPGKRGKSDREYWTPNIIGRHYRLRREFGGTHASPRMHWRRGHYRMQPYGKELAERKRIWMEPCLIAAEREESLCS